MTTAPKGLYTFTYNDCYVDTVNPVLSLIGIVHTCMDVIIIMHTFKG